MSPLIHKINRGGLSASGRDPHWLGQSGPLCPLRSPAREAAQGRPRCASAFERCAPALRSGGSAGLGWHVLNLSPENPGAGAFGGPRTGEQPSGSPADGACSLRTPLTEEAPYEGFSVFSLKASGKLTTAFRSPGWQFCGSGLYAEGSGGSRRGGCPPDPSGTKAEGPGRGPQSHSSRFRARLSSRHPLHPTPFSQPSHPRVGDGPVGTCGSLLILLGDTVPQSKPRPHGVRPVKATLSPRDQPLAGLELASALG